MKNKYIFYCCICIILSCNQDDFAPETNFGKGSVELNNKNYNFFAWRTNEEMNERISGYFYTYNNRGAKIGHLSLFNLSTQPGNYHFVNDTSPLFAKLDYYTIHDDHAAEFYQFIDDDLISRYEVEEHDPENRTLYITVEAVFQIPPNQEKLFENSPDTLFLKNGVFEINY